MRGSDTARLRHMLDASLEAMELAGGKSRQDLDNDRVLNLALARLVGIIGEAANRISAETKTEFPSMPWAKIVGMRKRLIQGYDNIDFDILHKTAAEDIPSLVLELEKILKRS